MRCLPMYFLILSLLASMSVASGQQVLCDQTPPQTRDPSPNPNKGIYTLSIVIKGNNSEKIYIPDQTYVLNLKTNNHTRPFRWFMITVEDPDGDNSTYKQKFNPGDVGSLKTLDKYRESRFSERCFNSVESADKSDKYEIEVHWKSPKQNNKKQRIRFRATVSENEEAWYTGENLTIELTQDDKKSLDSPPFPPNATCNLCSEARYETPTSYVGGNTDAGKLFQSFAARIMNDDDRLDVNNLLFKGKWSRMSHPRLYPSNPDENGYSHMVGASHAFDYTLWQKGDKASPGLQLLAKEANISLIEREIIEAMAAEAGTRTLIRGKRRHHPYMFEPSHSLFRVDRFHHLFSIVVAMKPSPDWFLGVSKFELCTDYGWLEWYELPLYPWDAGSVEGISYESEPVAAISEDVVDRVEVGSFNVDSPFYQMNLNDLKPFAYIEVRKLAEYRLEDVDCNNEEVQDGGNEEESNAGLEEELMEQPNVAESKMDIKNCVLSEWMEWSECVPDMGACGVGTQVRTRYREDGNRYFDAYTAHNSRIGEHEDCENGQIQSQFCYVDC